MTIHPGIIVKESEARRGCGERKVGGIYLVCDGPARDCGKMPIPLELCPCCGHGIKFSRAPVWLEQPERLWADMSCTHGKCHTCPLADGNETGPALLIWIGEKFYKTPSQFNREANLQGVSRRIKSVPRNFVVGETWVLLAHAKAIELPGEIMDKPSWQAGIFRVFRPTRIEIIVTGKEPDSVIDGYIKRGLTPVLIKSKQALPEKESAHTNPLL